MYVYVLHATKSGENQNLKLCSHSRIRGYLPVATIYDSSYESMGLFLFIFHPKPLRQ